MQQLENLAYEARPIQEQRQVVYQVGDLESLSASVLYAKDKMETGVDVAKDGTAYKFYTSLLPWNFGETELGIQGAGEKHKDYTKKMKEDGGISLGGGFSGFSSGGGY